MPELLRMPEIATGTNEAVLSSWSVAENATVSARDVVATVETEKAVVDVEAETDGVILRLLVEPGAEVETGAPIALVGAAGESVTDLDAASARARRDRVPTPATVEPHREPAGRSPSRCRRRHLRRRRWPGLPSRRLPRRPLARTAPTDCARPGLRQPAGAHGWRTRPDCAVEDLSGTGPGGRIVRRDVERAQAEGGPRAPQPLRRPCRRPGARVAGRGRVHATYRTRSCAGSSPTRLTESKTTAPHFYLRATVPVDRLLALRAELNDGRRDPVSVNDLVVKAVARAHVAVPELNVTWSRDAVRHYDRSTSRSRSRPTTGWSRRCCAGSRT